MRKSQLYFKNVFFPGIIDYFNNYLPMRTKIYETQARNDSCGKQYKMVPDRIVMYSGRCLQLVRKLNKFHAFK